ncbi:hypothetical protein GUJ93_ZPchr0010g8564 [Zizania palustris]|uniref:Uncharacterized protein n=1 Tax=Zizania palustris TaxID=103762 RepID=A0A8J5WDJ5_ZIZPA|nr:hypothetical protein GUJ93_ZPchr0010g8564 [Zizania palustris]
MAIRFDKRCNEDSSMEMATSLASANSLSTLQPSWSSEAYFLLIFLDVVASLGCQLHVLDSCLELRKTLLHGVAEVEQDERALKLSLCCFPQMYLAKENLVAGKAHEHDPLNFVVHSSYPLETIEHCFDG